MSIVCKLFGHRMSSEPKVVIANVGTYMAYCCERKSHDGTTECFHREPASQKDAELMGQQTHYAEQIMRQYR
jgi:hypothetical protein